MTRNLAGVFCLVIDEHNDQHTDSGESVMTRQVTSSSKSNAENNNLWLITCWPLFSVCRTVRNQHFCVIVAFLAFVTCLVTDRRGNNIGRVFTLSPSWLLPCPFWKASNAGMFVWFVYTFQCCVCCCAASLCLYTSLCIYLIYTGRVHSPKHSSQKKKINTVILFLKKKKISITIF